MAGLIFLAIFFALFLAALWLAKKLTCKLPAGFARTLATGLVVVLLLALLVADEIVGGFQFRALCEKNAVFKIDAAKIKGRAVKVSGEPVYKIQEGTVVKIYYSRHVYRDVETNEELASEGKYTAKGGWFIRALSFSDSMTPLTFPSTCSSPDRRDLTKVYEFKLVN